MDNDQTEELLEILCEIQKTLKQIANQTQTIWKKETE